MRRSLFHFVAAVSMAAASMISTAQAGTVTFGSGANAFNMEFVTIGNSGNVADTTGAPKAAGAVGYEYEIGKFEVSRDMITKYNASQSLQITLVDMTSFGGNGANKPATGISWNEAARFVNWLNTSSGFQAAYMFADGSDVNDNIQLWQSVDAGYDSSNPYRNRLAKYVLPSYNEWYKAAYYNPNDSTYYNFPDGSDTGPTAVASGTDVNTAVYDQSFAQGPADVDQAGGLSPYGVMGLGGNVFEWEESSFDLANSSGSSSRGLRGGNWIDYSNVFLSSSSRYDLGPRYESIFDIGFRVATNGGSGGGGEVPEPSTLAIFGLGALGIASSSRLKKST